MGTIGRKVPKRRQRGVIAIVMNQLLTPAIITLLLFTAAPSRAKNLASTRSKDTSTITIVRESLISQGIVAYKARNYPRAVWLLKTFLNSRRVIVTPAEKEGFNCLALAYQKVGEQAEATETIVRVRSLFNNSPVELANLENTAGIIAYQQNKKVIANKHWEKARQLYSDNNIREKWTKTTLKLIKSYRELGDISKSQQLFRELKNYNYRLVTTKALRQRKKQCF